MASRYAENTSRFTSGPYTERPIRFLEVWSQAGWQLKVYSISAKGEFCDPDLVAAAKAVAAKNLPQPALSSGRYGLGTLIVHEGNDANFVLLDHWAGENMLHHQVFASPLERPLELTDFSYTKLAMCVWELHVLAFERQAWIDTVLRRTENLTSTGTWRAVLRSPSVGLGHAGEIRQRAFRDVQA